VTGSNLLVAAGHGSTVNNAGEDATTEVTKPATLVSQSKDCILKE
jgi:hypothetical protein